MESEDVINPPPVTDDEHNPCLDKLETQSSTKKKEKKPTEKNSPPFQFDFYNQNYEKYVKIVGGSEGFTSFSDPPATICADIRPDSVNSKYVIKAARFAVEEHNKTTGANLELKKIVKANTQFQGRLVYYLTLKTLEGGETVFYEAKVYQGMHFCYEVTIFRRAIHYKVNGISSMDQFISNQISAYKRAYFDAHKDEEWLKNKYHPTILLGVIERRNIRAQKIAKDFLFYLSTGMVDLSPYAAPFHSSKSGQTCESSSADEAADIGGKRRKHDKGQDEESETSVYSSKSGQTSEPGSDDEAADAGGKRKKHDKEGQDGESEILVVPKAHPVSSLPRRIHSDIEQARALVQNLDIEKGIEDNVFCNIKIYREFNCGSLYQVLVVKCLASDRVLYGIKLLDTLLTYLWRIHGVDYYGMIESDEPRGFRHVRPDDKNHGETSESGAEWEKKLDSFWEKWLRDQDPLEAMAGKKKIDTAEIEALNQYFRKIDDENNGWKYGCEAKGCTELFHCAELAHEHLKLKHPEIVMELTSKVHEDLYFHNYMSDPDARGEAPDMQQLMLLGTYKMEEASVLKR